MVKKRVGGAHRYKAGHKAAGAGEHEQQQQPQRQQDAGPKPPSHLQRKITKSVKFYEKVLSQPAPKALQGVKKKKKKPAKPIASLDSLAAELSNISAAAAAAGGSGRASAANASQQQQQAVLAKGKGTRSSIKRSRARLAVGASEASRLQKVLAHPAYKTDPIQAVMNHLMNTLPAAAQQPQPPQQRKQGGIQQRRKGKQQRSHSSGGVVDMQD